MEYAEQSWFHKELRTLLHDLYSPSTLRQSPLLRLFGLGERTNPALALQQLLLEAIESLQSRGNTAAGSRAWRLYQILRRRYTEQLPQTQVARDLGLSVRQLQREEQHARGELAAYLDSLYHLGLGTATLSERQEDESVGTASESLAMPTRQQELAYLSTSAPAQILQISTVIEDVLAILAPLAATAQVTLRELQVEPAPPLFLQPSLLRQALLDLLIIAIQQAPASVVTIQTALVETQLQIIISSISQVTVDAESAQKHVEQLEMAMQLVELCQGQLTFTWPDSSTPTFQAFITLPLLEQATLLVIDDNSDTQQLLQRYLVGSRYRFVGALNGVGGLALAQELQPAGIVLDVMMPEQDGWALLGQLREHPQTRHIPVIICTILPQGELAIALGAADFLRKPVSRSQLLATLDRHLHNE
jgi:CheY-like chemotaxis protein